MRDALQRIRLFLDDAVNGPEPLVSAALRDDFRAAWPDVRIAFATVDQMIASGNHVTRLEEVGLSGPGLRLKASGLRGAFGRLMRGGAAFFRRNSRWFLSWANTILGSLAQVMPPAEIIKEFKQCVENDLAEHDGDPGGEATPTRA